MKTIIQSIIYLTIFSQFLTTAPIPLVSEGHEIANSSSQLKFSVFLDVHCADSFNYYKELRQTLDLQIGEKYVKDLISFKIHIYPLPYHRNSYLASVGMKFIEENYPTYFLTYLEKEFLSMANYNVQYRNLDEYTVRGLIREDVRQVLDVADDKINNIFEDDELNGKVRVSWKYGASKGVYGTPNLFVNDVANGDISMEGMMALISRFVGEAVYGKLKF